MAVFPSVFIFLGVVAMAASALAMRSSIDAATRVLGGGFSLAAWAVWSFYALGGVESAHRAVTHTYRPLAFLGVAAAFIMLLFTVMAAFATLRTGDSGRIDKLEGH